MNLCIRSRPIQEAKRPSSLAATTFTKDSLGEAQRAWGPNRPNSARSLLGETLRTVKWNVATLLTLPLHLHANLERQRQDCLCILCHHYLFMNHGEVGVLFRRPIDFKFSPLALLRSFSIEGRIDIVLIWPSYASTKLECWGFHSTPGDEL
jgi:hypothetical protein